jgi:AraC-like DNA-binding protein
LELPYRQRTFELFFESINLRNQSDIVYQYKVDKGDWSNPFDQQYLRFTTMEPGKHYLVLRSVSRTCGAVLDEVSLTIRISYPWWNTWWMWLIYICLVVLAFYGALHMYQLHDKYMRLIVENLNRSTDMMDNPENPESLENSESPIPLEDESNRFISQATKLVIDNIADSEFTIDRLCREMAMSRTLFYVKLKSYTGKSPQDFMRIIRLERAASLLRNGRNVTDAAALTGFDNPKYFSTVFKKYFGMSPSKYQ